MIGWKSVVSGGAVGAMVSAGLVDAGLVDGTPVIAGGWVVLVLLFAVHLAPGGSKPAPVAGPLQRPCPCGHDLVFHTEHSGCGKYRTSYSDQYSCHATPGQVAELQPVQDRPLGDDD